MTSTEPLPPLSASDADDIASNGAAPKIAPDSSPSVSPTLSTPNAKHSPSSPSSPWKDLPRRLLTVAIGVPSIIFILRHSLTSWLFFQGAHILCLIEWFALMPPVSSPSFHFTNLKFVDEKYNVNERKLTNVPCRGGGHTARFLETLQKKIIPPSLARILLDNHSCHGGAAAVQLRLSRWLYLQFFTCSIFLSIVPTKFLPLCLMVSVLALRLSLYLPWFHPVSRIMIGNAEMVSKETTPNSQEKTISGFNAGGSETQQEQNQEQQQHTSQQLVALQHYQLGFLSVSLGFHYLLQIAIFQGGPMHIGFLLFVVWMADTGALIFGRVYGRFFAMQRQQKQQQQNLQQANQQQRQQLYYENSGFLMSFVKSISPGKTLPGIIGAIVTGPISALLYPIDFDHYNSDSCQFNGDPTSHGTPIISGVCTDERSDLQLTVGIPEKKFLLGILLSLTGIIGDLAESSVKRTARAKDSGGFLPGHGGILDRFDSVLVSGVVYYYFILV